MRENSTLVAAYPTLQPDYYREETLTASLLLCRLFQDSPPVCR